MFLALTILTTSLASGPPIQVEGNVLFNRYVYANVIDMPEAPYNEQALRGVEQQVLEFLRGSGYTLARVRARTEGDIIVLTIDEGRLRRTRLLGRGTFETLGLRKDLELPLDVFNRPLLEERLAEIEVPEGEEPVRYEIIDVERQESNIALDTLALVPGIAPVVLPADGDYELRVYLPKPLFGGGWRLSVGADSDGLLAGLRYREKGLFSEDDRWEVEGKGGVNFFENVDESGNDFTFSRMSLAGRYWAPNIGDFRPQTLAIADYVLRQRFDIGLEDYWWFRVTGLLGFGYTIMDQAEIAIGGGLEYRNVEFGEQLDGFELPETVDETRGLLALGVETEFGIPVGRPDRAHRLEVELRHYFAGNTGSFQSLQARYQKVFPFGYDDFWVTSALAVNFGDFTEFDEPEVSSRFLRGVFGNQNFVEGIGAAGVEYRYSIDRDVIKIGVYHDLAGYQESSFPVREARFRVANAFGVGVHALLFDHFQLDVYTGSGFLSDGSNSFGTTFRLQRAF